MSRPSVVLSYGLGVDSTAILLRWINEPASRDFDLSDLLVITAMTGDEWSLTGALVERHILPLMRRHGIRYAQVARATASQSDGVAVLDDSRAPERLYIRGAYKLSDELFSAGTVPQRGGARLCSAKSKGWALDKYILQVTEGRPFRHVIGFEANEGTRARKDCTYNTDIRGGEYPLIEWGWNRQRCEQYIRDTLGVDWPKSACTFCPFALENKASRERTLARFEADPDDGYQALLLEYVSLALNPVQRLMTKGPLFDQMSLRSQGEFISRLWSEPHAVYEVRRVLRPTKADPTRLANAARSVRTLYAGHRVDALTELKRLGWVDSDGPYHRIWLARRPTVFPGVEHVITLAPALVDDKQHDKFESWWSDLMAVEQEVAA